MEDATFGLLDFPSLVVIRNSDADHSGTLMLALVLFFLLIGLRENNYGEDGGGNNEG